MTLRELKAKYNLHKARCCSCGCSLSSPLPLGSVFVLDKGGNYFCMGCDAIFEDGDERIFEEELYNE